MGVETSNFYQPTTNLFQFFARGNLAGLSAPLRDWFLEIRGIFLRKIGWGGWTRTSEWQNQNLLTYQLVDTPTSVFDYELRKVRKSGF